MQTEGKNGGGQGPSYTQATWEALSSPIRSLSMRLYILHQFTHTISHSWHALFRSSVYHDEICLSWWNLPKTIPAHSHPLLRSQALSCPDYPVTNYSAILSLPEGMPQRLGLFLPSGNSPETINVTEADGLLEDRMYTASVEARNQFGGTVSEARTICKWKVVSHPPSFHQFLCIMGNSMSLADHKSAQRGRLGA